MSPAKLDLTNRSLLCLGLHMRIEAYGSHFMCVCVSVCVCVCFERICFFRGLWANVFLRILYCVSKYATCRFAKQRLYF